MKVELNDFEKEVGMMIAKKRHNMNRDKGVFDDRQTDKMTELEPDIEGAMSELAFCKITGVYPENVFTFGISSKRKGTDGGDAKVNGKVFDVKSTKHLGGRLIARKNNPHVDVYALMVGQGGSYDFKGVMESKDFISSKRYGDHFMFRTPVFMALQKELIPWEEYINA